jgi:hypothetical protein
MKQFIRLSAALLGVTLLCVAATPSPDAEKGVLKAEDSFKQAVLKGDRNTLDKLLFDDLSYTHSSAKTQTKEQFIQDATGGSTVYKAIDFEDTKLRQYGTVIVVTHRAVIKTVQTGTSRLYLTEVWAQDHGHWRMASRQATKLP